MLSEQSLEQVVGVAEKEMREREQIVNFTVHFPLVHFLNRAKGKFGPSALENVFDARQGQKSGFDPAFKWFGLIIVSSAVVEIAHSETGVGRGRKTVELSPGRNRCFRDGQDAQHRLEKLLEIARELELLEHVNNFV